MDNFENKIKIIFKNYTINKKISLTIRWYFFCNCCQKIFHIDIMLSEKNFFISYFNYIQYKIIEIKQNK